MISGLTYEGVLLRAIRQALMKLRRELSGLHGESAEFCRAGERNEAVCDDCRRRKGLKSNFPALYV